jgi:DNA polymerase-3 subunit delta'
VSDVLFAGIEGQHQALELLSAALLQQRLAPAYLFAGPDGVGRSMVARRFLEGLCAGGLQADPDLRRRLQQGNHPDLLWVEPTYLEKGERITATEAKERGLSKKTLPQIRLEQIREVSRFLARPPLDASRSMVVIEQAEAMAEAAANALLKTLEEPGQGLLVLIAAAPERLLATILSRCQRIPFKPLPAHTMLQLVGGAQDDPPELLDLAAGSPGALLLWRERWAELPPELLAQLQQLPGQPIDAMALAREVCEVLDTEQQLWLLQWWQWHLWRQQAKETVQKRLTKLRRHLLGHVQPRLAWEVALLDLIA